MDDRHPGSLMSFYAKCVGRVAKIHCQCYDERRSIAGNAKEHRVTKVQWQELAERWLVDADTLLNDRRWGAAYYLAGYAVECGLKACILGRVAASPEVISLDNRFSQRFFTHN